MFEPLSDTIKNTSEKLTELMTDNSSGNNKALSNLNEKHLEILKDRCTIASYLLSPLSKITNLELTSQYKLVKDSI